MSDEQFNWESGEFEELVQEARQGEQLIDPQTGKHDAAVLAEASFTNTERGGYLELKWSGMIDINGNQFDKVDRVYLPVPTPDEAEENQKRANFIRKTQFNDKMKNLGVFPATYSASKQGQLYFESDVAKEKLTAAVHRHIGESYPITVKQDAGGYISIQVRRRSRAF